jgi:hypothetical protein
MIGLFKRLRSVQRGTAGRGGESGDWKQHRSRLTNRFAEQAVRLRARTPRGDVNSTDFIRWDRDHNYDSDTNGL